MINFYYPFLLGLVGHLHPLYEACKGRGQSITWSDDCQIAFDIAKSDLASAALLEHPNNGCKLAITMDASDFAVGGSLDQFHDGSGTHLPSSARNLPQPNESMPLLTESSPYYILASNSFATMSKADHSQPSLIISPLLLGA